MTALAVTLLSGTSALAQDGRERSGFIGRVVRETAAEAQRNAPPQRESRPQEQQQQQPQRQAPAEARPQQRGDEGRRGRDGGSQAQVAAQAQVQAQAQAQAQRPQGNWQGQRGSGQGASAQGRSGSQTYNGQSRYQGQQQAQGQRAPGAQQGQGRSDGQYDRDRRSDDGFFGRTVRETQRQANSNSRPGWNNDRGGYDRRPEIRPEDRRDRDRNRPRYDQRRYPHYVTPQQRYRWIGPSYRLPPSFYSFRWQWGQTLPWDWYTPNYYLNDYYAYGLPMPPIGCEWVRVGDDAILVDVFTGRIYQVVYNLFW